MVVASRIRSALAWSVLLLAFASSVSASDAKAPEERSVLPLELGRRLLGKESSRTSKKSKLGLSKGTSISGKGAKSSGPSLSSKSAKSSSKLSKRSKGFPSSKASQPAVRRRPKGGHAAQKKNDSNDLDVILRSPDIAASLGVVNEEDLLDVMRAEWSTERIAEEKALLEGSQQ